MLIYNNYNFNTNQIQWNTNRNSNIRNCQPKTDQNIHFTANVYAASEKSLQKFEYGFRVLGNRIIDFLESQKIKQTINKISNYTPEPTSKYLSQLNCISRFYSTDKTVSVNIEDKILENIAKNGKSTIFMMNHSNQIQDPSMLAVLNTLLIKAYKEAGREQNFPLPKIILNEDILTSLNPTKQKAFKAFGAVGIDANIYSADKTKNARAFLPLIKDFVKDKSNIFIFPEGRLAIRKDLDFNHRFQTGIAELVNKVLAIKKEVTVVPVGFAYGKWSKRSYTGMHIGTPVTFTRQGENTTTTKGSVLSSDFASDKFKDYFKQNGNNNDIVIKENGTPVKPGQITDFIKGILSENLNICSKEAVKRVDTIKKEEIINI